MKTIYRRTVILSATFPIIVVSALLVLSGCASLGKADCLSGDWYEIGLRDGKSGLESARFEKYVDTCARYGVHPDFAKYSEGRTKGLEFFCTRDVGYSEGRLGRVYQYVCSGISEELFLEGHSLGYNVHATEEVVEELDSTISKKQKNIESLEHQVDEITRVGSRGQIDLESDQITNSLILSQDITKMKTQIKELQDRRAEAIIEFQNAVDEANENGFREEAIVEFPEVDDEGSVTGTNP